MRSLRVRHTQVSAYLFLASFCPLYIHVGDRVSVTVRWAHEASPGVLYTYRIGPIVSAVEGLAEVNAEGHPTGCTWVLNGREVVFYDGFESGGVEAWTSE